MNGSSLTTLTDNGFVSVVVLPDQHSRHNTPAKSWSLSDLLKNPQYQNRQRLSLWQQGNLFGYFHCYS